MLTYYLKEEKQKDTMFLWQILIYSWMIAPRKELLLYLLFTGFSYNRNIKTSC